MKFFDLRTKLSNFWGSILREKHVPWNFSTKLTEPIRQIKTAFPMKIRIGQKGGFRIPKLQTETGSWNPVRIYVFSTAETAEERRGSLAPVLKGIWPLQAILLTARSTLHASAGWSRRSLPSSLCDLSRNCAYALLPSTSATDPPLPASLKNTR